METTGEDLPQPGGDGKRGKHSSPTGSQIPVLFSGPESSPVTENKVGPWPRDFSNNSHAQIASDSLSPAGAQGGPSPRDSHQNRLRKANQDPQVRTMDPTELLRQKLEIKRSQAPKFEIQISQPRKLHTHEVKTLQLHRCLRHPRDIPQLTHQKWLRQEKLA